MNTSGENRPARVPAKATQAGEARPDRWDWVERSVWTERMLDALERGVKGGVWFSLIDKVFRPGTLEKAWQQVRANKGAAGVDHQSVRDFERDAARNLAQLEKELREGTYRPHPVRRVWIDKPGSKEKRPLGVPCVRDRVVQAALRMVVEPIFEREFAERSYGFRPGRGCKDALRRVDHLLKSGHFWVVDADLKGYFDSIPHEPLMAEVRRRVADGRVLELVEGFLKQGVMEGAELWEPEGGTPQGGVISPLLANVYLHPVDVAVAAAGYEMVRYADDFVILCRSREEAEAALGLARSLLEARGLVLHPEKTRIVDARQRPGGFDFLGYHFEGDKRWPRAKSMKRLRDTLREPTRRTSGESMARIVARLNPVLRGWFEYYKHGYRTTFPDVDGWVRRRLRSLLRKRSKRRGICRGGDDNHRWPNAYFRRLGLFFLADAHALLVQSRRG